MRSTLKCDIICLRIVGVSYMKTKIIYISGNEIFDMVEIRAAFDEVRGALGLDNDTILFGVPVDKDNAIEKPVATDTPTSTCANSQPDTAADNLVVAQEIKPEIITTIIDSQPEPITETEVAETNEVSQDNAPEHHEEERVIPILSILATKKEANQTEDVLETPVSNEIEAEKEYTENTKQAEPEIIVQTVSIETEQTTLEDNEIVSETITETVIAATEPTEPDDFANIIDEEVPEAPTKKTLEQLLESMTPLREDHENRATISKNTIDDMPVFDMSDASEDSEDATLAQLASEFAESADKIVATSKPENHGKIGKLKNILPFKKAKRDDSGLMGDLFGWAGIAANDEDFSIPGFFTKKQGA